MAATRSSRVLSPFAFSNLSRYYIIVFFVLAIWGALIDHSTGADFPSDSNIAIRLSYPLAVVFFFWLAIDTLIWIVRKPTEFLEIAKRKGGRKRGSLLSQNPSKIWFYYFFSIFMLLIGSVILMGTIRALTG